MDASQRADSPVVLYSHHPLLNRTDFSSGQREITLQCRRKRLVSDNLGQGRNAFLPTTGNHPAINSIVLDVINDCTSL